VRVACAQVAERRVRAPDEEAAIRRVREELNQPYGFLGRWQTVSVDIDAVEAESTPGLSPRGVPSDGPLVLPVKDATAHLGIARSSLYELLNTGELPSIRIGRRRLVSREVITRFVSEQDGASAA
jgi:excisionase family DNA binding protein